MENNQHVDEDFFEMPESEKSDSDSVDVDMLEEEEPELEIPKESKISQTLTDHTIKTVIVMVLLLLFSLPILSFEQTWDNYKKNLHE